MQMVCKYLSCKLVVNPGHARGHGRWMGASFCSRMGVSFAMDAYLNVSVFTANLAVDQLAMQRVIYICSIELR